MAQFCLTLCDPETVAQQAPLSLEFSRQEYWSGLPFPSPGDLLEPGIELRSPAMQVDSLPSEPPGKTFNLNYLLKSPISKHSHIGGSTCEFWENTILSIKKSCLFYFSES